jgi:hypothetical protein
MKKCVLKIYLNLNFIFQNNCLKNLGEVSNLLNGNFSELVTCQLKLDDLIKDNEQAKIIPMVSVFVSFSDAYASV